MVKVYFGEWANGRLKRLPYLGYYLLLIVLFVAIIFGGIFAMGATENIMGGDIAATQAILLERFGFAAIIGFFVFMIVMMIAQINILAKRIRDMGLPPVWTIFGIIMVSLILNILFPAQSVEVSTAVVKTAENATATVGAETTTASMMVQLFDLIVFLCLILIPSDAFGKNK